MDLLETLLRNAKAADYIQNFRDYDIEVSSLPILSDEDLKLIGIDDENVRCNVLNLARNLKIPSE